jgi:hypothetical protein
MIRPDESEAALSACKTLIHVLIDNGLAVKTDIADAMEYAADFLKYAAEAKRPMVEDGDELERQKSAALLLDQLARSIRSATAPTPTRGRH